MASALNETILELDTLQKKYDELKLDERRYYQWWHDETKETDRLKAILDKTGMASEPVEADESNWQILPMLSARLCNNRDSQVPQLRGFFCA